MGEREVDEDGRELPPIELYPGVSIDGGWQAVDESTAEAAARYFEHNPDGMTPPGFKRSDEGLRATDLRVCYTDEMGFTVNAKAGEARRKAAEKADAEKCPTCGDAHDYTAKECANFLTFGQGGADFEESQLLAALYDKEATCPTCGEAAEWRDIEGHPDGGKYFCPPGCNIPAPQQAGA